MRPLIEVDVMAAIAYIAFGAMVFLCGLAKGAVRFHVGPRWLRHLIIDERAR